MSYWDLAGNSSTNPVTDFIGTTDTIQLMFKVGNYIGCLDGACGNICWGLNTLIANGTSDNNIVIGTNAAANGNDIHSTVAIGYNSLNSISDGNYNTAIGLNSLLTNVSGSNNMGLGASAGKYIHDPYGLIILNTLDRGDETGDLGQSPLIIQQDDTNPNNQLATFNTQIRINDGSQGVNKVFTSDSTGLGTWTTVISPTNICWAKTGNSGTTIGTDFIGTSDNKGLLFKTNNIQSGYIDLLKSNTSFGQGSLLNNSTGTFNTAIGYQALKTNTAGINNTAIGYQALTSNTLSCQDNTAIGYLALSSNTTGYANTAVGSSALPSSTTGSYNTSVGMQSMQGNTTGYANTAIGFESLVQNTTGAQNTGVGYQTLYINSTGINNSAFGWQSTELTTGNNNSGFGYMSLRNTSSGNANIGIGTYAGIYNTSGSNQIFINSLDRANYTGDQTKSPIYIQQDNSVASQTISLNGKVKISGILNLGGYTASTLPTGILGDIAYITDAMNPSYLNTIVGGGSIKCPVFFDGTNWVYH